MQSASKISRAYPISPNNARFFPLSPMSTPTKCVSQSRSLARNPLYKTELCRQFVQSQPCKYGAKCQFAHGKHELRPVQLHPHFKTKICRNFERTGKCPYGVHCNFLHGFNDPLKNVAVYESVREMIVGRQARWPRLNGAFDVTDCDSNCSSDSADERMLRSPLPQFSWISPFSKR